MERGRIYVKNNAPGNDRPFGFECGDGAISTRENNANKGISECSGLKILSLLPG